MPPKKVAPAKKARKKLVPLNELRDVVSKLESQRLKLVAIITRAEEAGMDGLDMDGANAFDRAYQDVKVFVNGAHRAVEMAVE